MSFLLRRNSLESIKNSLKLNARNLRLNTRAFSDVISPEEREREIADKITRELDASSVQVLDTSGGCGTMYRISVVSRRFEGKGLLEQHRMVNDVLKEEVKSWHGVTITTAKK